MFWKLKKRGVSQVTATSNNIEDINCLNYKLPNYYKHIQSLQVQEIKSMGKKIKVAIMLGRSTFVGRLLSKKSIY
jgi:hypothetical protein